MTEDVLLQEVNNVSKVMQLNEIEIAYWSLLLDNLQWKDLDFTFNKLLWVTAFQIKVWFRIIDSVI